MVIIFDLSAIPKQHEIREAVLSFYVFDHGIQEGTSGKPDNDEKSLYRILGTWEEDSVTWDNQPAFSNATLDNNSNTAVKVWEDYTVTSAVQEMVKDESTNHGFILKFPYEDDYTGARIRSSETTEQAERPRLTVTYNLDTGIKNNLFLNSKQLLIRKTAESIYISVPFSSHHTITISDVKGRFLASIRTDRNKQWYQIPAHLSSGIAIVSISMPEKKSYKKFLVIR